MRRRALCGVVLGLLLLPEVGAGVRALAEASAVLCACTPHVCRCRHHHGGATRPHCHFPGGSPPAGEPTPGGPVIQRCKTDTPPAAPAELFLLPAPAALWQPVVAHAMTLAEARIVPSFTPEPPSPPPRPSR